MNIRIFLTDPVQIKYFQSDKSKVSRYEVSDTI